MRVMRAEAGIHNYRCIAGIAVGSTHPTISCLRGLSLSILLNMYTSPLLNPIAMRSAGLIPALIFSLISLVLVMATSSPLDGP